MLVMIIDDSSVTLAMLRNAFEMKGHEVRTFEDGLYGLMNVRSINPDVILLDIVLPAMDGWEILKRLKADKELRRIPVVMMTISETNASRDKVLAQGAEELIIKPSFDNLEVINALVDKVVSIGKRSVAG